MQGALLCSHQALVKYMQVCRRPDSIASWAWHAALPSAAALHVWLTLKNTLQALPAALRVSAALRLAAAALAAACWARPPDPGYPGPSPSAPLCGLIPTLGLPPLPAMLLWQAALVAAAFAWLRLRPSLWARLVRHSFGSGVRDQGSGFRLYARGYYAGPQVAFCITA